MPPQPSSLIPLSTVPARPLDLSCLGFPHPNAARAGWRPRRLTWCSQELFLTFRRFSRARAPSSACSPHRSATLIPKCAHVPLAPTPPRYPGPPCCPSILQTSVAPTERELRELPSYPPPSPPRPQHPPPASSPPAQPVGSVTAAAEARAPRERPAEEETLHGWLRHRPPSRLQGQRRMAAAEARPESAAGVGRARRGRGEALGGLLSRSFKACLSHSVALRPAWTPTLPAERAWDSVGSPIPTAPPPSTHPPVRVIYTRAPLSGRFPIRNIDPGRGPRAASIPLRLGI